MVDEPDDMLFPGQLCHNMSGAYARFTWFDKGSCRVWILYFGVDGPLLDSGYAACLCHDYKHMVASLRLQFPDGQFSKAWQLDEV